MTTNSLPNRDQLQRWLDDLHVTHYLCDQCEGLHIPALQELEGAVDSRLLQQDYGLLFTTELEIRPMALMAIAADLGRLNMDYPTLKIFVDVVDDATPQLVMACLFPTAGSLTQAQFSPFVTDTMAAVSQLATECLQLDYLFQAPQPAGGTPSRALH